MKNVQQKAKDIDEAGWDKARDMLSIARKQLIQFSKLYIFFTFHNLFYLHSLTFNLNQLYFHF